MIRTPTLNNSVIIAGLVTLTVAACNSIVGLNDLSLSDGSTGGSDSPSNGGSSANSGGSGNEPISGAGSETA